MTSPTTAVGFAGLGTMGSALSAHLLAAGNANDLFGPGLPGALS